MIHWNLIRRELMRAAQQSLIFVLCVALALVTLAGLNSFGESVRQALLNDARQLQAGDVIVRSPQPPSSCRFRCRLPSRLRAGCRAPATANPCAAFDPFLTGYGIGPGPS